MSAMKRTDASTGSIRFLALPRKGWIAIFGAVVWLLPIASAQDEKTASAPAPNWTGTLGDCSDA